MGEHCVVEAKPDSELGDLRLTDPFPELRRFADSVPIELPRGAEGALDEVQHGHTPYVVIAGRLIESYKAEGVSIDTKILEEIVHYGGSELHTISSILGGIAAQEAVKLVTKQFIPLMNTYIH